MSGLGVTPFGRALKKAGQYHGITHSAGEIIACTDADCQVGSAWLRSIANEFNYANPDFLTGPVFVPSEGTWISRFEDLDARGTMAMTKAGISSGHIHLANGANMAFKRKAYDAYTMSTQNIRASGDDVFLVRWLAQNGYSIRFNANPSAIVMTSPKRRWIDLWQQRLRWATKTRDYLASKVVVLYVFLWIFFAGIVLSPLYLLLHPGWWWLVTIPFLSKLLADVWLFKAMERSYQLAVVRWRHVIPLSFIYCCYFLAMSVCGLFVKSYHWKGRKVS